MLTCPYHLMMLQCYRNIWATNSWYNVTNRYIGIIINASWDWLSQVSVGGRRCSTWTRSYHSTLSSTQLDARIKIVHFLLPLIPALQNNILLRFIFMALRIILTYWARSLIYNSLSFLYCFWKQSESSLICNNKLKQRYCILSIWYSTFYYLIN